MRVIQWIEAGRPLGVPFVIVREAYVNVYGGVEKTAGMLVRSLEVAIEHYKEECKAGIAERLPMDDSRGDLLPESEYVYVSVPVAYPGLLRAGIKVCMRSSASVGP